MELISVIIPVFNTAPYLERCMDSILHQTWSNLQVIAVDDGSTDGSGKILDGYQEKDSRVMVIHQKNRGVSAARNAGLAAALGDYVGFIDSDDAAHPELYEVLLNLAKQHDTPIAHCGYRRIAQDGSTKDVSGTDALLVQDQREAMECLLLGKRFVGSLCNKLFARDLLSNLFLEEDIKVNEDLLLVYQLFKKADKSVYFDRSLYFMYERPGSATGSGTDEKKRRQDALCVAEWIVEDSRKTPFEDVAYIRYIEVLAVEYAKILFTQKNETQKNIRKKLVETKWHCRKLRGLLKVKIIMLLYFPLLYALVIKVYRKIRGTNWDTV